MGFFVRQWDRRKDQSYMFFHNVSWVPGKLSVQVCDKAGEPLMESGFKRLPSITYQNRPNGNYTAGGHFP
jgi:hypothetical protein